MFRYRCIDFSRGVAAILIAIVHWNVFMIDAEWGTHSAGGLVPPVPSLLWPIYDYGSLGVQYFWMISGFIFAFVYGKSDIGLTEFFGRRVARLYPLHIVTLVAVALCQMVLIILVGTALFIPANDLYHFGLNLLFIPSLGFEAGPSFNSPIWSVAIEVPIYLLFWICLRYLPLNTGTALIIAAVFFLLQRYITFNHLDYCGMMFFIGVAIFYASQWFEPKALSVLAVACFLGWVVGASVFPNISSSNTVVLVMSFGLPLVILGALDRLWVGRNMILDRLAAFGDLSYSIYLIHLPLLMLISIGMAGLGLDRGLLSGNVTAMLVYLGITIWVSHLSLTWFEAPARRWLRSAFKPATGMTKSVES
ncbi:acyltransferase [Rhodobacteraceae bacterium]|nr:acyltransferase [Paracoccaceae bacterium]